MTGIACPQCGSFLNGVTETRKSEGLIRRYRRCVKCGTKFATIEVIEAEGEKK